MSIRREHNCVCVQGFEYLMKYQLVDDTAEELAKFLHSNRQLDPQKKREFLSTRLADMLLISVKEIITDVCVKFLTARPHSDFDSSVTVCPTFTGRQKNCHMYLLLILLYVL